jgi:predicted Rossmann fold flavoprotein
VEGSIISQKVDYHDSIILGAGASGLMAAYKYRKRDIALIDANSDIARKLKISGGGKCNITNTSLHPSNFYGDSHFVKEVLDHFSRDDLLSFLAKHGVKPVIRKDRYYFCKDSSDEIIAIFRKHLKPDIFYLGEKVISVKKDGDFIIQTQERTFRSKNLIVATGGLSYPRIGASDIAFKIAEDFGHQINTLKPALVGFTVQKEQFWFKALSGLSIKVEIKVKEKHFCDDMLFTHKGISGPVVLNASLYWDRGEIEIDFLPDISLKKLEKLSKKKIPLPKRFLHAFLEKYPLAMLKAYRFAPAGNFGYTKAEVTRGGIDTKEIDVSTMMSKIVENLFFIGECVDVTGELGGYNFQWAFSSAWRLRLG